MSPNGTRKSQEIAERRPARYEEKVKGTPIQRRGRVLIGLLLAASTLEPNLASAQAAGSGGSQEQAPVASQEAPDQASPEESSGQPSSGIEERVVLAGESDAVADFSSSDSVTGFNAADLEAAGAFNVADIAKFTPNLEIVTAGQTSPTFFIRGVGPQRLQLQLLGRGRDLPGRCPHQLARPAARNALRHGAVNVQRGPQGTGPARNASAGAIKLYTRKPSGNYGAYMRSSYGRFNAIDVEGAVEAPIVEDIVGSRFAFRLTQRDGFAKNGCGGAPPFDRARRASAAPGSQLAAHGPPLVDLR